MSRTQPIFIIFALLLGIFASCNSSDDIDYSLDEIELPANTAITAFSLASDDSVLSYLDSVYFSIDLNTAQIYNADSLPVGTDISRLVVNITTSSASAVDVIVPTSEGNDTINYLEHTTDSIDFSRGPVTVRVTAANTTTKRDYTVRVNVHQIVPDSLYWNQTAMRPLPTALNTVTWQKTVEYKDLAYCFSGTGRQMCIATSANPGTDQWTIKGTTLPFTPNSATIAASSNALYMLDTDGNLYSSPDGLTWTSCSQQWLNIYGGYQDKVLGIRRDNSRLLTVTYPATSEAVADPEFPVSDTSVPVIFSTSWQTQPQAIMVGGVKADGRLTGATWGYDGQRWMKISIANLPERSGMTLFPYFTYRAMGSIAWQVTEFTAWIAIGGTNASGSVEKDVYISLDAGIHWKKADQFMQLPDYIPGVNHTQALVFTSVLTGRSASQWTPMPDRALPAWLTVKRTPGSRAVAPITQWDCPYIYLFGGYDAHGSVYNTVWRGVINRMTFKPIQ